MLLLPPHARESLKCHHRPVLSVLEPVGGAREASLAQCSGRLLGNVVFLSFKGWEGALE